MQTIIVDGQELKIFEADKILIYSASGEAVPDALAEEYALQLLTKNTLHVSTDNVLHNARVLYKEGRIKAAVFSVLVIDKNGLTFQSFLDKDGRMDDWHSDLCRMDNVYARMLGWD